MNGLTAFLTVTAVFAVSLPAAYWQIRRAQRAESERDRFIREACTPGLDVWDDNLNRWITLPPGVKPGPGQYTDREVVSLDRLELAWDAPAYGETAADPAWAAGLERLWDAVRDHHTNTPEGDQ
jgi:hypothetical protein